MSSYAILRIAKLKQGNLAGTCSHVDRSRPTPNADFDKTDLNVTLTGPPGVSSLAAIQSRIDQVKRKRSELGARALRKDAVYAVEHVLTASPEFFAGLTQDQVQGWADHSLRFLQDRFGEKNLVHAVLHMDESTPHIHAYHVPVGEDPKGRPTLSAKQYYDGKNKLSDLQTAYAEHIQRAFPSLKRGIKASKARHQKVSQWYSEVNAKPSPKAPPINVPEPPSCWSRKAKQGWARETTAKLQKRLEALLRRYKKLFRIARHYKNLYLTERDRTERYRELAKDPAELSSLIEDNRIARLEYKQGLERIKAASEQQQKAERDRDWAISRFEELSYKNQALRYDLEALSEAVGISPEDVQAKAPAVKKVFERYRHQIRSLGLTRN